MELNMRFLIIFLLGAVEIQCTSSEKFKSPWKHIKITNILANNQSPETNDLENNILTFNEKFFRNMVNLNHELYAVESFPKADQSSQSIMEQTVKKEDILPQQESSYSSLDSDTEETKVKELSNPIKTNKKTNPPVETSNGAHSRQKRFLDPKKLRTVVVPFSIFHYLGFLPMRIPGLPYHIDPGVPDYSVYRPVNEIPLYLGKNNEYYGGDTYSDYKRRRQFY